MDEKLTEAYSVPNPGAVNQNILTPPPYTDAPPAYSEFVRESYEHTTYLGSPAAPHTAVNGLHVGLASTVPHTATVTSYQSITVQYPPGLAPNPQVAEITKIGRRKTLTHVTDLNTGKEYNIVKKQSRSGRRSKEVIREVGGPTTIVKQTPFRTIIKQK